jgi:NADH dehydrogenase [ubiquinone] 1 alpha subcomplex assembly factor 5
VLVSALLPSSPLLYTISMRSSLLPRRIPILTKCNRRCYAIQAPGNPAIQVFDSRTKWQHKQRHASHPQQSRQVDYLRDEVGARLCDRLLDIKRTFPRVLDSGANACNIARILTTLPEEVRTTTSGDREQEIGTISKRIGEITCVDHSEALLYRDKDDTFNNQINIKREVLTNPEYLPYEPNTFDLAISSMSLHWLNDLPSVLTQLNSCLKPDAPLLAAMPGVETLFELRGSLQLAEQERLGGIAPHISPFADVRDVGNLLNRAGFKLLTVDVDDIIVDYPSIFALMADLQAMGEANAALAREKGPMKREVLLAAEAIYRELYGEEQEDGSIAIPATFRTIYMIGWKEAPGQAKPLERGTGEANLTDVLGGGGRIG